ncbi:Dynein heavy chain 2, axonemal [Rhizoclosmatium hyalinum]|nr:Dynein heavy chain 2, axonemal [Rhizoclosmatium hyalinum]
MGKPTDIRDWNIQGLPSDAFSAENGIIVTKGRRWPLMIDPQGQANTWIKNMEAKRDLKIIDLKQPDFLRTLENAIQYGIPVLLQGLAESIDPALDPVLNKSVVKKGGLLVIKLGDKEVEYNPDFRFYLTTKLANPKYPPEVFAKATIVNFAVKEKGLEDQLLGIVVRREKPELEEQKNALVSNVAAAKRKLVELEDEILYLLSTAQGSLLDDEKLVNTLQSSKSIAEEVTQQLVVSEQTEKRIDAAREGYRPSAKRASILYFVLNDLATVDPMYQFSLDAYVDLFEKSIGKSKRFEDLGERITSLNEYHTYAVYKNTCRETYHKTKKPEVYEKLLFSLCFFHSLLLERKKFLTLGWNVTCDFNNSDFDVCENILVVLLDEYPETPWDALKYLIAEANYGGRITDDWDRRILRSYISQLFNEEALTEPQYKVCSMPNYYIPENTDLVTVREYINTFPGLDKPEVFGQHPNADIASQIRESANMLLSLLSLQPQVSSAGGVSREEKVSAIAADILKKLPEDIDYEGTKRQFSLDSSPLIVVLLQEIQRYNVLLGNMRKSCIDIQNAVKGIIVMTSDLEETFNAISDGRVPLLWGKAFFTLKPLASWTRDLLLRLEHFNEWSKGNEPKLFWLGAFTFPTGFLTAILQKTARKNNIPIDVLSWEFNVLQLEDDNPNHIQSAPKEGAYIKNLYLEGAGFDRKNNCLKDSKPMELITPLPPVHFKPVESKKKSGKGLYACPLYYYPIRTGTRERPSYIVTLDLKAGGFDQDFYIKKGTAALASLA